MTGLALPAGLPRVLRFAGVGIAATAVHAIVAILCAAGLGASPQAANLMGFTAAVGVSYAGHGRVTFRVAGHHTHRLPRFVVVALAGLGASSAITALVSDVAGLPVWCAMAAMAVIVPPLTYTAGRVWVFADRQSAVVQ